VTEIQNALIKAGYLDGPASGQYDEATVDAMKEFQARHSLPRTGMPSAMALKRLGVSKRPNDGYAVPVNKLSEGEKKSSQP
jgi:peptidoglycan hydrolase-like protein with peptidoglycan-binding domain